MKRPSAAFRAALVAIFVAGPGSGAFADPAVSSGFGSGCSGSGPGIVTGRVPGYGPDTGGVVRMVSDDAQGQAFVSEFERENAVKQWMAQKFSDPRNVSAFAKNPFVDPSRPDQFRGDPHDTNAVLAFIQNRIAMSRAALAAVSTAKVMQIEKDGSFVCRGLDPGKYRLIAQMNHVPSSAVMAGPSGTGMSQTTEEAAVEIPRVKPGQRVLVQVTRFSVLSSLKH